MFLENIIQVIKEELNIDLQSDMSRKANVVDARRIYSDLSRQLNIFSFSEIGKKIGKDHATILHLKRTSEDYRKTDKNYLFKYNLIFDKTIKIHDKESVIERYHYYKEKHYKYRDLYREIKEELKHNAIKKSA